MGVQTALRKLNKQTIIFVVMALMFNALTMLSSPSVEANTGPDVEVESAILIEAETGKILFDKNLDEPLPSASMSKMMTEYLVLEAISNGDLDWDTTVTISNEAYFHGTLPTSSVVFLNAGDEHTIEQLYTAMAVYSGNDATVALAEAVAGSEAQFVQLMNDKAEELGMTNAHFVNASGLPNDMLGDNMPSGTQADENLMSARDTAILARALLNDYPEVLRFSSIPEGDFVHNNGNTIHMINWNWMLPGNPQAEARAHSYPGIDGLKTGYTSAAGNCFTGTAERDGMRLISVVMGADTRDDRFRETSKLLDYGFNFFEFKDLASAGDIIEGTETLPVAKGKETEVYVELDSDIRTVVHKDEADLYSVVYEEDNEHLDEEGNILAPVEEGEIVGHVRLQYDGERPDTFIQSDEAEKVALVAQHGVEEAGWIRLTFRSLTGFLGGVWGSAVEGIKGWFS
ncbi:D-alanyl-D-alanine carboxypeptidase family protein [Caldalkalibacillus salinus]|uniref:D-alanyl-D-alanine carboxypeptidase family protein n=1 Tax=Caldalkalibacillus salinus TaxID=2803787 RepID=UPI0019208B7C|nr:D-alanyl-D-alanine carboxypeptidase family protein [Caldalkalibacillus salinus]